MVLFASYNKPISELDLKRSPSLRQAVQESLHPVNRKVVALFLPLLCSHKSVQRGFWPSSSESGDGVEVGRAGKWLTALWTASWSLAPADVYTDSFPLSTVLRSLEILLPLLGNSHKNLSVFLSLVFAQGPRVSLADALPFSRYPDPSLLRGFIGTSDPWVALSTWGHAHTWSHVLLWGPGDTILLVMNPPLQLQEAKFLTPSPGWGPRLPPPLPLFLPSMSEPCFLRDRSCPWKHTCKAFHLGVSLVASLGLHFWFGRKCSLECQWGNKGWGRQAENTG